MRPRFHRAWYYRAVDLCRACDDADDRPYDATMRHFMRRHREIGRRDARAIGSLALSTLRHRRRLDWALARAQIASTWEHRVLLNVVAGDQATVDELLPGTQATAWEPALHELRPETRSPPSDPAERLSVMGGLPLTLCENLLARMAEPEALALAEALHTPGPLTLRVNPSNVDRTEFAATLREQGHDVSLGELSPFAVHVNGRPRLDQSASYRSGQFEIQDEGSQVLALLWSGCEGALVVDLCAGAGGKILAIAAHDPRARMIACDVSATRLSKLEPRRERSGLPPIETRVITDAPTSLRDVQGQVDAILVDAPCTGLGAIRRSPEVSARVTHDDVERHASLQRKLLRDALLLLRPGGHCVYATCSLHTLENEHVVDHVLSATTGFELVNPSDTLRRAGVIAENIVRDDVVELWPHRHGTDGFFAALIRRVG